MELGIRLSFVKTSEFRGGGGVWTSPRYAIASKQPIGYSMDDT
jgi:hypothetical protein